MMAITAIRCAMTEKAFHLKHINKLIQNYGSSAVFSQMADIPAKILRDTAAGLAEIDPIWVRQIENRMGYADGRLNLEDTLPLIPKRIVFWSEWRSTCNHG